MVVEDDSATDLSAFQHPTARNLLLFVTEIDDVPEWACLETWSSGPDARARTRARRSASERRHRL